MLAGVIVNIQPPIWVPNPEQFTAQEWANALPPVFDDVRGFVDEERWQEWADRLCLSKVGRAYSVPSPYGFDRWQEWAIRVFQILQ